MSQLVSDIKVFQERARGHRPPIASFRNGIDPEVEELINEYALRVNFPRQVICAPLNASEEKKAFIGTRKAGGKPPAPRFQQNTESIMRVIGLKKLIMEFLSKFEGLQRRGFQDVNSCSATAIIVNQIEDDLRKVYYAERISRDAPHAYACKRFMQIAYGDLDRDTTEAAERRWKILKGLLGHPAPAGGKTLTCGDVAILRNKRVKAVQFLKVFTHACRQFPALDAVEFHLSPTTSATAIDGNPTSDGVFWVNINRSWDSSWYDGLRTIAQGVWYLCAFMNRRGLTKGLGAGDYGLAMSEAFADQFFGDIRSAREHCYDVFAVQKALEGGGFVDIYEAVLQRLADANEQDIYAQAWDVAERAVRGTIDCSGNALGYANTGALAGFRGQNLFREFRRTGLAHFAESGVTDYEALLRLAEHYDWAETSFECGDIEDTLRRFVMSDLVPSIR